MKIILIIVLIQIFHLSVSNLTTKTFTETYKCSSYFPVFIFTQLSCFIVYVPLLLRIANDVEENPGPTVYDVVDPAKTICADFSQGDARKFRQNAGKQCVAMSLTAIVHNHINNVVTWDSSFLNEILCAGNNFYTCISNPVNKSFLLLSDVPEMVSVSDKIYDLKFSDPYAGDLFTTTIDLPYYSLEEAFNNLFSDMQLNYQYCLLTIGCNTVSIFKASEGNFKIFDPHSRDLYGIPHPFGKCVLVSVEGVSNLVIYFQNTVPPGVTPFEVKGVTIQLINSEMTQQGSPTSHLDESINSNECVKQKRSVESENEKTTRLQNARKYKKAKQTGETESEKQTRLERSRLYQKKKRAGETEIEKQTRLENARKYRKRKQLQETAVQKQDASVIKENRGNLTQVEEMLIARALSIMRVYIKPGGQRGYSGHCINLPQNVTELATSLPRYPKDLAVIIVKVKGRDNTFKDVSVRREKVHDALLWLVHNNPHYAELDINEIALNLLPENDIPADLMTVETESEVVLDDGVIPDLGPITDNNSEDTVYNHSTEMSSFLPVGEQQEQEVEAVRNQLCANDPMIWPTTENEPLNTKVS
ncbi:ATP-dependent DNA helicase PIF1 [Paramuricea clavata]|uniref:ATP-dependent DNA helicase PIF1 n=1 Tax=Paramuricea clavata TaxID=317549 RepID=A0A7D9HKC0_PARCT|nr:ATP-dependent DNA helicase PIF1 [Paramuricea clavata]